MSKADNSRKGSNLCYYSGAKFDTIPALSILPTLPSHWKLSESKSTPSSPVPTSVFETNSIRHSSGSNVPSTSGRNTAPVLKASSLPSPTGHDITASYKKMVRSSGDRNGYHSGMDKMEHVAINLKNVDKEKKGNQKERTPPPPATAYNNGAHKAPTTSSSISIPKEGHILMAMLQSGKVKTESIKTEVSPKLAPIESLNVQSSPVKMSVENLIKLNSELRISTPPKQAQRSMCGTSCQLAYADSSEHLKALLKVCT